jgi:uncharacterized protein with PQ loop repeat
MKAEAIGWAASGILVVTIGRQLYRQWKAGTSKGVSKWLFIGQFSANACFAVYSVMVKNYVFIFTNCVMALAAATGLSIVLWHRRKNPDEAEAAE